MLVRGASGTPESTPAVTSAATRKRKHPAIDDDGSETAQNDTQRTNELPTSVSAINRPRLTESRHPIFGPPIDGSPFHVIEVSAINRQLDRVAWKYVPAGIAKPGAAIAYRTIETLPKSTRVSWEDRSPCIKVTKDGLGLTVDKGFCSARANVGVQEGKWYMEVRIAKGGGEKVVMNGINKQEGAHVRLGWGRREAPLNGPVGLDGYSYGLRDKTGDKVTLSRPKPYGRPFGTGDVVGLYISLPPRRRPNPRDPDDPAHIYRSRIAIELKGQEYFEYADYVQSKEMISLMNQPTKAVKTETPHQTKKSATVKNLPNDRPRVDPVVKKEAPQRQLPILPGSKIAFFVNGECQGIAFQDIYDYLQLRPTQKTKEKEKARKNTKDDSREHKENLFDDGSLGYYPFFSLFGGAQMFLNPGPNFQFPPPADIDALLTNTTPSTARSRTWRPMSERYPEFMKQEWDLDEKEEAAKRKEDAEKAAREAAKETAKEAKEAAKKGQEVQPSSSSQVALAPPDQAAIDAQEEKKRAQRERRRKTEQIRRKRKAEEKKAAAAAAAAADGGAGVPLARVGEASRFIFMDGPGTSSAVSSSPAPSAAAVDMDIDEALVAAVTNTRTPTPVSHTMKSEYGERDYFVNTSHKTAGASSPPSSDVFARGQQDDRWLEEQSDYEREQEPDSESNIDHEIEQILPTEREWKQRGSSRAY